MTIDSRREAFESVAAQVYEPLQRYLRRRCAHDDIDEVFNDTLTVLWRRVDTVPSDMILPWCYGIARRCLSNHRRGSHRRLRLVRKVETDVDRSPSPTPTSETDVALQAALDVLNDLDREVVRLWAWEQLEPREIAEALGTSANAVSVRLNRIHRRLEAELPRQNRIASGHKPTKGHLELET